MTRKPRTRIKALTYKEKIPGVLSGEIRQTIRPISFRVFKTHRIPEPVIPGDIILFHGWQARPYKSPWSWRLKVRVDEMLYTKIYREGIAKPQRDHMALSTPTARLGFIPWANLDKLARLDGIKDGETMGELFNSMYELESVDCHAVNPQATKYFQIIRWSWPPLESIGGI